MKKTLKALAALLVLALALTACGGSTASSSAPKNYAEILAAARNNEDNEYYEILAPGENGYTAAQGHADEMSADYIKDYGDMLLELMGFSAEDATDYALSVSMMNVQSYGLAIVKPAEGKMATSRKANVMPTARASMLVATARMNSLRPLVGSAEQLSPSSESSPPPRIMLPPIHASSAKAIQ